MFRDLLLLVEGLQPNTVHGRLNVVLEAIPDPVLARFELLHVTPVNVVAFRADLLENVHGPFVHIQV